MDGPTVLTTIHSPPKVDDFTPISEHQERTPETFFGGRPVLHYHCAGAQALVPASQRRRLPVFRTAESATGNGNGELGSPDDAEEELVEQTLDVFVNSSTFTLFSQDATCGVSIPYPLIGIHAVKTLERASGPVQCVYMQLDLQDGGADDETYDTVELTIIPPTDPARAAAAAATPSAPADATTTTAAATTTTTTTTATRSEAAALFAAISACAELHPDAEEDEEDGDEAYGYEIDDRVVFESSYHHHHPAAADGFDPAAGVFTGASDGGLPPPLPGSSGWITADNVHEYFDTDGNWIGGGAGGDGDGEAELGEGAGRVRGRDEAEAQEAAAAASSSAAAAAAAAGEAGVNGHRADGDDPENKRQRTE